MQNIGYNEDLGGGSAGSYHNNIDLGKTYHNLNRGQTETKDGIPYLLRKGKWERSFDYNPEAIENMSDVEKEHRKDLSERARNNIAKMVKSSYKMRYRVKSQRGIRENNQEQPLHMEILKPNTPRMKATADKLIPSEIPGGYLVTIAGVPWLFDTTTNKPIHPLFDAKNSPKEFSYTKNKTGQGDEPKPTNAYR
jgi:hypothetical protein